MRKTWAAIMGVAALCGGIVLAPAPAFALSLSTITVEFQGVMTTGSDTDSSASLVGLPFTATVFDTPAYILNDGYNGSVTITPTSFYLGIYNGGPMSVSFSVGGQYLGTGDVSGEEGILSGGSAGGGNNFSFRIMTTMDGFTPENPNGLDPFSNYFLATGNFVGTAPYMDPFSGASMSSPGTGEVSFDAEWETSNPNAEPSTFASPFTTHRITGTADITGIVVSGVPEPSTWALLILGVAMIGLAARRRREGMFLAA
jgi:hypothetical protein